MVNVRLFHIIHIYFKTSTFITSELRTAYWNLHRALRMHNQVKSRRAIKAIKSKLSQPRWSSLYISVSPITRTACVAVYENSSSTRATYMCENQIINILAGRTPFAKLNPDGCVRVRASFIQGTKLWIRWCLPNQILTVSEPVAPVGSGYYDRPSGTISNPRHATAPRVSRAPRAPVGV